MATTNIPFPDIPQAPGVPQLLRPVSTAIAENPVLSIGLGTVENVLIASLQQAPRWGIFNQDGSQLGINPNSGGILSAIGGTLVSQLTGSVPTQLTVGSLEFTRESRISDFPIEASNADGAAGFSSYNKVGMPATITVTLILQGSVNDRTMLLEALDAAVQGTDLYYVLTPEIQYGNAVGSGYSIERYQYARKAERGITLLLAEVTLKEIRQVSAQYSTVTIVTPQNPSAAAQVNSGLQQPQTPPPSILSQGSTALTGLITSLGAN